MAYSRPVVCVVECVFFYVMPVGCAGKVKGKTCTNSMSASRFALEWEKMLQKLSECSSTLWRANSGTFLSGLQSFKVVKHLLNMPRLTTSTEEQNQKKVNSVTGLVHRTEE
jgi:hypothetical protein